jgi:hypothetical protein
MGKNHNSRYIEKFGLQNPLKKFSLVSILPHHIIIEFLFNKFYSIKNIIWRCMKFIFIDYGLLQVFFVLFKKSIILSQFKNYSKKIIQCDYNIHIIVVLSLLLTESIIFNYISNFKFQNLAKSGLWQQLLNSVVCFHPSSFGQIQTKMYSTNF